MHQELCEDFVRATWRWLQAVQGLLELANEMLLSSLKVAVWLLLVEVLLQSAI